MRDLDDDDDAATKSKSNTPATPSVSMHDDIRRKILMWLLGFFGFEIVMSKLAPIFLLFFIKDHIFYLTVMSIMKDMYSITFMSICGFLTIALIFYFGDLTIKPNK